jgi:REP element-mobilizing transposase RayT
VAQSLARNIIHLVFSTKHREPTLTTELRPRLHAYMSGILTNWDSPAITIGSVTDHAHLLFVLSKNHALCKVVEEVKKGSSKWVKDNGGPDHFHWQNGYGAFSVSPSNLEQVAAYVDHQEEHHRKTTFQDEFRGILKRHGIDFDERYVWD